MSILIMTIPVALTLAILFILLFVLAAKKGQMDDLTETPSYAPLIDDDNPVDGDKREQE